MKQIWNYRIVNTKTANGGEDWYCLREVFYDLKDKPVGHADPCLGSETAESFGNVWHMMAEAVQLPPLQEEDFKNEN